MFAASEAAGAGLLYRHNFVPPARKGGVVVSSEITHTHYDTYLSNTMQVQEASPREKHRPQKIEIPYSQWVRDAYLRPKVTKVSVQAPNITTEYSADSRNRTPRARVSLQI